MNKEIETQPATSFETLDAGTGNDVSGSGILELVSAAELVQGLIGHCVGYDGLGWSHPRLRRRRDACT